MKTKWDIAADMLQEAADTIRERGTLRDVEGCADTISVASQKSGFPIESVLKVHIATKEARYERAGDYDSALDLLAYRARLYAEGAKIAPIVFVEKPLPDSVQALIDHTHAADEAVS